MPLTRRDFVLSGGMAFVAAGALGRPALALAHAPTEPRLFVVILRGALDGLAAVVPHGDRSYGAARGDLAMPDKALIRLDPFFAMNAALGSLADLYQQKQLLVLHATATPYRSRSHFDGQDVLDSGAIEAHSLATGWLNRALGALQGGEGIALGPAIPLLLQGPALVTSWSPSVLPGASPDLLARIARLYQDDPLLSRAVRDAETLQADASDAMPLAARPGAARGGQAFEAMMQKAGELLGGDTGLRLGAIELGGWDTHVAQGLDRGRLTNAMQQLSAGLAAFRKALGPVWQKTAVLVVTEFGRTVRGNGTGGSDHGTGTVAFLMGGSVAGGRVIGDWPGLAPRELYQDRDLRPVNDLRAFLKGVLAEHMGLSEPVLDGAVFPGSADVSPLRGLLRA
jgi:uncharacterized protein (DUF1501 family)